MAGTYANVADGAVGVQVVDVADPQNPQVVGGSERAVQSETVALSAAGTSCCGTAEMMPALAWGRASTGSASSLPKVSRPTGWSSSDSVIDFDCDSCGSHFA